MLSTEIKLGVYYVQYGLKSKKKSLLCPGNYTFFWNFFNPHYCTVFAKKINLASFYDTFRKNRNILMM